MPSDVNDYEIAATRKKKIPDTEARRSLSSLRRREVLVLTQPLPPSYSNQDRREFERLKRGSTAFDESPVASSGGLVRHVCNWLLSEFMPTNQILSDRCAP